jgi:hypothetical protein
VSTKGYSRNFGWWGLAILVVLALAATGSQCSKVEDSTTAPTTSLDNAEHGNGGYAACIRACVAEARNARIEELRTHLANLRHCGHNLHCIREENIRHRAAMLQIARDEIQCKSECHQQGEGHGGQ